MEADGRVSGSRGLRPRSDPRPLHRCMSAGAEPRLRDGPSIALERRAQPPIDDRRARGQQEPMSTNDPSDYTSRTALGLRGPESSPDPVLRPSIPPGPGPAATIT